MATDPNDLSEQIAANAAAPASMSVDGQSATQHSLADQIAADKYLASKRAGRRVPFGLTIVKGISAGAQE